MQGKQIIACWKYEYSNQRTITVKISTQKTYFRMVKTNLNWKSKEHYVLYNIAMPTLAFYCFSVLQESQKAHLSICPIYL